MSTIYNRKIITNLKHHTHMNAIKVKGFKLFVKVDICLHRNNTEKGGK